MDISRFYYFFQDLSVDVFDYLRVVSSLQNYSAKIDLRILRFVFVNPAHVALLHEEEHIRQTLLISQIQLRRVYLLYHVLYEVSYLDKNLHQVLLVYRLNVLVNWLRHQVDKDAVRVSIDYSRFYVEIIQQNIQFLEHHESHPAGKLVSVFVEVLLAVLGFLAQRKSANLLFQVFLHKLDSLLYVVPSVRSRRLCYFQTENLRIFRTALSVNRIRNHLQRELQNVEDHFLHLVFA